MAKFKLVSLFPFFREHLFIVVVKALCAQVANTQCCRRKSIARLGGGGSFLHASL